MKNLIVSVVVAGLILTAIVLVARIIDSVSVDPSARYSWHVPCHTESELCTDGEKCQYLKLREHCWIHPRRFLQFREFREQKELASNKLMDKELVTGKYDWASHKKDVASREWNRKR